MKPVYEIERRSINRWLELMTLAFGIFLALSFCGMVIAQVAVQLTPPAATPPHPPTVVPSAAPTPPAQPATVTVSPDRGIVTTAAPAPLAVKWEYKLASTRQQLAELGKEGWELVAVTQPINGAPTFYLKRPLHGAAAADDKLGEERHSVQPESHDIRETPKPETHIR